MSLARRFLALQLGLVVVISLVVAGVMVWQTHTRVTEQAQAVTRVATGTLVDDPFVRDALLSADPHPRLQELTSTLERDTAVDFITIMTPDGTRITHHDEDLVGQQYLGDRSHALRGEVHTATEVGRLGPSVRTIAPVRDRDGSIIGLVSSGVLVNRIAAESRHELPGLALIVGALLAAASVVCVLVARYLNRVTDGRSPESLVRGLALNRAVLSRAREGLVLLDPADRPVLSNTRAGELLGVTPGEQRGSSPKDTRFEPYDDARSGPGSPRRGRGLSGPRGIARRRRRPAAEPVPPAVAELLARADTFTDERCTVAGRTLVASCTRVSEDSGLRVLMVQDQTELSRMSGELDTVRTMAAGLRAQTHEHANRMHTVVSLLELERYPQARDFAASTLEGSVRLGDTAREIEDPYVAALLAGKTATAHERGVELVVVTHGQVPPLAVDPSELVSVLGNLVDNAVDAVSGVDPTDRPGEEEPPTVEVELVPSRDGRLVHLTVADNGPGIRSDVRERLFDHGVTTKPATDAPRGVGLHVVRRVVEGWGTELTVSHEAGAVFSVDIPAQHPAHDREENR
ncbi:GHKL domain-containing protein [Kocuria indica]|uniref:GHKL domain-containing protein n=1 Tax=Kocuria marina subsp. indica TaxID=1049583 RepID=A0A6N9QW76_9MICC|nr:MULTISPECIES: ATP-binding protein [Kocuria]MCT1615070.1 ATP-binding protein [Kocuria marina]NDO76678.1 GHKL domain-containing protein [Kocuria indica]